MPLSNLSSMTRSAPRHKTSEFWRLSECEAPGAAISTPVPSRAVDWGEARKLLGSGSWMFSTPVLLTALSSIDQFVIGSVMGVASVAHYFVPMSLVQKEPRPSRWRRADSVPRMSSCLAMRLPGHNLPDRGVHQSCVFRSWLFVFRGLALAHSGADQPSARFLQQSDRPS
jgi:hypothetical protein